MTTVISLVHMCSLIMFPPAFFTPPRPHCPNFPGVFFFFSISSLGVFDPGPALQPRVSRLVELQIRLVLKEGEFTPLCFLIRDGGTTTSLPLFFPLPLFSCSATAVVIISLCRGPSLPRPASGTIRFCPPSSVHASEAKQGICVFEYLFASVFSFFFFFTFVAHPFLQACPSLLSSLYRVNSVPTVKCRNTLPGIKRSPLLEERSAQPEAVEYVIR